MRLSDTLHAGAIVTGASWPDFDAVVAGLIARLVQCGQVPPALQTRAALAVSERERMTSTAMVDIGVSIPHTRFDGVEHVVSALALSPGAIYGATSGMPISIVALVLSPPALTGEHLNLLASLSMLLHSPVVRRSLQNASSPPEALQLIRAHERR